jgi:hypothetical protein
MTVLAMGGVGSVISRTNNGTMEGRLIQLWGNVVKVPC